jgi:hypothetical protein
MEHLIGMLSVSTLSEGKRIISSREIICLYLNFRSFIIAVNRNIWKESRLERKRYAQ